jgi:oligoendopeptidase F
LERAVSAPEETWNLTDLFDDDARFQQAKQEFVDRLLPEVDRLQGRLLESPQKLAEALEAGSAAAERLQLLHCYAALKSDQDLRVSDYQAMRQEVELLGTDLARRAAFVRPEILSAPPEQVERGLEREPRLAPYAHFLRDLLRQRPHVLGASEERIVAETGLLRGHPGTLYGVLTNTELPRPTVELSDGSSVELTTVAFQKHRATQNREDRLKIFPSFFSAYERFQDSLGLNLYAGLKGQLFRTRVRGYDSCLSAALDSDNLPETVYRNLIQQVRRRLPIFHRYMALRARALGLEQLEYPDLYCPLTPAPPRRYEIGKARELVTGSMEPLGETYLSALEQAFSSRWIDWHPSPGKRSGAYATGWAYPVHPYVLLNFNGDYEGVLTVAHEMGHAMHSYFSNLAQPFPTADYSIFVAEVASTFNEALLLERTFAEAESREERISLLGSYLDGIRGTLYRQTMFAEFELQIHERAEAGEVLTGDRLNELYLRLLRLYHGHDEGVVRIDDRYAVEWACVPHFYYPFYVYQYATGIIAASALARAVIEGQAGAVERYLGFLRAGGSSYPLEILRNAGVDLEQAAPYDEAFASITERLDQLEEWLDPTCR